MKNRVLVVLVLIIAVSVMVLMARHKKENRRQLLITGTVEATTVTTSFKVPGRLKKRYFDEGASVRAGELLAELEDDELHDETRLRMAEKQVALAMLADLEAGSRKEEIAAAEATLARLRAEAVRAGQDAARAEALFVKEVIPRRELDAARAAKLATAAAVREGEEHLGLVRAGARPDAIDAARGRAAAASSALSLAETRLSQATLVSPLAGMVLAKHAEPGELLAAGSPVLTVARLDEVWVRGYIPETELGRIKLGQQATVTCDTWKGRTYQGKVTFIASEAEFTPRNVQTEAERVKLVYRIKVTIPNPRQELKPGMPVDVRLANNDAA